MATTRSPSSPTQVFLVGRLRSKQGVRGPGSFRHVALPSPRALESSLVWRLSTGGDLSGHHFYPCPIGQDLVT